MGVQEKPVYGYHRDTVRVAFDFHFTGEVA